MPYGVVDRWNLDRIHSRAGFHPSVVYGPDDNPWAKTLYVSSAHARASDSARNGEKFSHPLKTIARAVAVANANDRIVVGPGHVETIDAATDLDITTAGLRLVGVGRGANRPKLDFTTTINAIAKLNAAGIELHNFQLECSIDAQSFMLSVLGADCLISGCRIYGDGSSQAVYGVAFGVDADNSVIRNCEIFQETAGGTAGIYCNGTDGLVVKDCWIHGDYSAGCFSNITTAATNLLITNNHLESSHANDVCIDLVGTATGWITRNLCRVATDAETTWIDSSDCQLAENYGVNADAETGMLIGAVSA